MLPDKVKPAVACVPPDISGEETDTLAVLTLYPDPPDITEILLLLKFKLLIDH